jgi:hypothetical protein
MSSSSVLRGPAGRAVPDTPGWGCFVPVVLGSVAVFAVLRTAWREPQWDANLLAGVLMTPLIVGLAGLGLYHFFAWLFPSAEAKPASVEALSGDVSLERYQPSASGVWLLWAVTLFWNIPVGVATGGAIDLLTRSWNAVPVLVFAAIFTFLGGVLLVLTFLMTLEQWPRLRGVRAAQVTVSAHPLRPGGRYELALLQPGPMPLGELHVSVLCEVQRSYPDSEGGTITKMEPVFRAELLREQDLDPSEAAPYTARRSFSLPDDARPSCEKDPDQVRWTVIVGGRRRGWWWPFRLDYPVTVSAHSP